MKRRRFAAVLLAGLLAVVSACAPKGSSEPDPAPEPPPSQQEEPGGQTAELKELKFQLYTYTNPRPYNPVGKALAEAVQQELAKIGVTAEIVSLPWDQYKVAVLQNNEGQAVFFGWIGDNGDPDNFLYVHFDSSQVDDLNSSKYSNPQVDEYLRAARTVSDPAERQKHYEAAQKIIAEEAPWVFFNHMTDFAAMNQAVSGYSLHPTGWVDLRSVDIDKPNKTLIYARGSDAINLDPARIDDGESAKVVSQIFEGLYTYAPDSTDVVPLLAAALPEVSNDGKTYTIPLKPGVKFHDGTDFTAEAVKLSIERQIINPLEDMSYADFTFGNVESVEVVDPLTVKIHLKQPEAPFLANLAMQLAAPIISPASIEAVGNENVNDLPVGTGPFKFVKWDKGQQIVLQRNENYHGEAPKLEQVIFKVTRENSVRVDELLKGEVDIIDGIDPIDLPRLQSAANVTLLETPGMNINYMAFRTDREPFNDVRVRQALSMAIDREAIVEALYQGTGTLANGALPPFMPGYAASVQPHPYDPEQAKKLLNEAGYATK